MREKRRKIWIDRFQTYLFVRIGIYCVLYQAAVWLLILIWQQSRESVMAMLGEAGAVSTFLLAASVLVLMGFLFIYDALKFAHRIVGPIYRFRKTIEAITAGEDMEPMRLRKDDFLQDLKDEMNKMMEVLEERGALTYKMPEPKQEPADKTLVAS